VAIVALSPQGVKCVAKITLIVNTSAFAFPLLGLLPAKLFAQTAEALASAVLQY
tara:strand:- start:351 stop:512 length:162 start_codon:yes stop_codon:yes gene_type:complete